MRDTFIFVGVVKDSALALVMIIRVCAEETVTVHKISEIILAN